MNTGLQGKVAIITGASKGIGKAIALALATEGVRLAICARDDHALKLAADEIQSQTHADVVAVKANSTRLNDIRRFVNAAIKRFNRIDILANNAGTLHTGGISTTSDEDWEYQIQLKLLGYVRMAREVIKHMRLNGGGKIINIVGATGKEPNPAHLVSGVLNAALLNFTKVLARELEPDRIFVNAVNPSMVESVPTNNTPEKPIPAGQISAEESDLSPARSSTNVRARTPEDVANAVLFLASEQASHLNGTSINVDAGRSAGL